MMGTPVSEKLSHFYLIQASRNESVNINSIKLSTDMEFTQFFLILA